MKSFYYTFLFISLISIFSLHSVSAATVTDSIHTLEYIESISIAEPHRALRLIDETEKLRLMPQYGLDQLRGIVYQNGLSMYRTALIYTLKAYRTDSIRRHPDEMLVTLRLLTYQYNSTGNYTESIRYAIEGIELARRTGKKASEAGFLLYIAINKRNMGLKKEAAPYLEQSIRLMEEETAGSRVWGKVDDLIYFYGMTATFAYEDGDDQKAINLLPRYHRLMEQYKACEDLPAGIYDMRLASISIMYASIFAADGQMDKAEKYYRDFDATDYAHTDEGNQMRFEYLVTTRRYPEALRYIRVDKANHRAQGDTVSYPYVERTLCLEAKAYMGLGDYKAAAHTYRQMYTLADSLRIREKQNGVLEYAAIYETQEKEAQLVKQAARLRESRMTLLFAACLILLLGLLLWRTVRHSRIVKAKNAAMVKTIREQLSYKDELYKNRGRMLALQEKLQLQKGNPKRPLPEEPDKRTAEEQDTLPEMPENTGKPYPGMGPRSEAKPRSETEPCSEPEPSFGIAPSYVAEVPSLTESVYTSDEYGDTGMQDLFARAEHEIVSRKLYLHPDFSKEELLKTVRIPKNKFAGLFKEYAGTGFLQYINTLRMEHAARMLSDYPNYTIETIARECGIANVRTFYRLFYDTYQMTPGEFRTVHLCAENK